MAQNKSQFFPILFGGLAIVFVAHQCSLMMSDVPTSVTHTTQSSQATSPECNIPKKDGSMDARKCDLEELCKDWVFYRRKILLYSSEGNESGAANARNSFNRVNEWLSAYKDSDVSACLTRNGG
jgi:hypothetical protein